MRHIQLFLFRILFHYLFCQNRVVNIMVSKFFECCITADKQINKHVLFGTSREFQSDNLA